ncbi:MAG: M20/M25/M40 family metallo-hydrolase [Anaerolineales bacterium]|nr:M20/M25/M40 family metallo-hydrolase [Anaerolineales bacterium]
MKQLIQKLTEVYGPSGHEDAVRDLVRAEIQGLADSVTIDPLGNLIAIRKGKGRGGRKVALAAHLDEIGLIVSHIDARGFVRVTNVGGVRPLYAAGGRVRFTNGAIGAIGVETRRERPDHIPTLNDLYVDFGVARAADVPVRVGDVGAFMGAFTVLPGGRVMSKSLDDRAGVAVLIEALRRLKTSPHEVAFMFTVQEELGLRGAGPAAFTFEPEIVLAVDVTATGDTPNGARMAVALGAGAAIKAKDTGLLVDPRLRDLLVKRATEARLPYQLEVLEGGRTDAAEMQLARGGAVAGCISIPCRYVHAPSEVVDLGDVEAAVGLLVATLSKPIEL